MQLFEAFQEVPDPRKAGHGYRHQFLDVLCLALCAVLSGGESFVDMEDYGVSKETWLRERLGLTLPNGIPSHDTFGRLFSLLDPQAFHSCFVGWTQTLHHAVRGSLEAGGETGREGSEEFLSIDGKRLCGSFDTATGRGALHLVSVWAHQARLVLAQQAVPNKSNEMTAVPLLLEMLDITGCVVTTDALNTQKNIAATIVEKKGDYVLALKENHRHLFEDVRDTFLWGQKQQGGLVRLCQGVWHSGEWGHGRHEVRRVFALSTPGDEWPQAVRDWAGLRCGVMVERQRTILPPEGVPPGAVLQPTCTRHFYLSSLLPDDPRLEKAIRAHWGIENSLHWVLDVAFDEDGCRVRKDHADQNFATLRKLALNLLRQDKKAKCGVKTRRKRAGWNDDYLLDILGGTT